ncbi:hypothetical protein XOO4850 [Xanthomonas oryzae pv. oryzae KACC 10331]|uniref:Uncharacterized protein n=1 Tax=Xanthomonas oryzae pv. oryzae (strain KACC10331 / KXO85) TaxID=291331 RepID=Q05HW4_XANOR|nr:hypothetical protein XOO4850 [Xanthomonas oryzae pv. oryzae KACC 10331]
MQAITPKQWIGAPQAKGDTVPLSSADALKAVLEYRGVAGEISEPAQLPHHRKPAAISTSSGGYKADVLHANSTRYPWALRTHSMSGASAEQALQQRYARICAASHNGKQGDQRQTYMPMLLGLWDAVGVVHELNGYRHDVVAAMARYKDERAMEFNAMEHIEQIDTLLQRNAAVLSDQYAQASRARMEEIEQEHSGGNALTQSGIGRAARARDCLLQRGHVGTGCPRRCCRCTSGRRGRAGKRRIGHGSTRPRTRRSRPTRSGSVRRRWSCWPSARRCWAHGCPIRCFWPHWRTTTALRHRAGCASRRSSPMRSKGWAWTRTVAGSCRTWRAIWM